MKEVECILLVDDSEADLYLHQLTIKESGRDIEVQTAHDGRQAFDYLMKAEAGATSWPDIVILDINMPVMNGWEFLAKYHDHAWDGRCCLMVAMLSTSDDPDDIERAREAGAGSYVSKPLTPAAFEQILGKFTDIC